MNAKEFYDKLIYPERMREFLDTCQAAISYLEEIENYERCASILSLIKAIKERDVETYINLNFDIEGLEKEGFLKKGMTTQEIEERFMKFFGIESIFEFSLIGGSILNLRELCAQ